MLKPRTPTDAAGAADLAGLDAWLAPASADSEAQAAPVVNRLDGTERVSALKEQMLSAFRTQAPMRYREIDAAIAAKDWNSAAILAHGIKGCLAFIAPTGLAYELSDWLERMADSEEEDEFIESYALLKGELQASLGISDAAEG